MRRYFYSLFIGILLLTACAPTPAPTNAPVALTVFAAASLTEAFTEIGEAFEAQHAGVTVTFNFGGSQTLRTQLEQGASADVFASANAKEMEAAIAAALVDAGTAQIFATNDLVVIVPPNNPAQITTLADLAKPGLKLVLAAEEVPVGQYARQSLAKMNTVYGADFQTNVLANVVSNEDNVRQVAAKVQLGEADAGLVYATDAKALPVLLTLGIPPELNVAANYPIARLTAAPHAQGANTFVQFVLSKAGQAILSKWGFATTK